MKKTELASNSIHSFLVNGTERNYIKAEPFDPKNIVFVFHGNGGTADGFKKKYVLEKVFTRSVVIYLQGIPGIGGGFDPKGLKNGWQRKSGDGDDRDLKAIDILLPIVLKEYPDLKNQIYAMGHSNGGRFVYLLWNQRPALFNGFIINAHQGVDLLEQSVPPKSAFICTGSQDKVVNNSNQMKSVAIIKEALLLQSIENKTDQLTVYTDKGKSISLFHYIHAGGHDLPKLVLPWINEFLIKTQDRP